MRGLIYGQARPLYRSRSRRRAALVHQAVSRLAVVFPRREYTALCRVVVRELDRCRPSVRRF